MDSLTLEPLGKAQGTINLPGSKSLSNRALLLAALANGKTKVTNLLDSDDIRHMLNALKQLGVQYELSECKTQCDVIGLGGPFNSNKKQSLFLGNAGTAMRPLCAALCLGKGEFELTGEPRMEERPIGHLVDSLKQMGAQIEYLKHKDYPPLNIVASGLKGATVSVDGSISSQFLTGLLMAAPMADGETEIHISGELVSKPYIDITLHIMAQFGVKVEHNNYQVFHVGGNQTYQSPGNFMVEGDASSASYFLAAAAVSGGEVTVTGVGSDSVQGDKAFADVLEKMGAHISWQPTSITCKGDSLKGVDMDMNHIPDAAMTIATAALFAKGDTCIRNIYNWRVKETDRLSAMATELKKLGVDVVEGEDFIKVSPAPELKHAAIDTYNDHRIAMCFSLVAFSGTSVTINDPGCTSKTFPDYFDKLGSITRSA